jgi:anti-sigma regulatory factor (Ser/Thr protein kinase)
MSFEIFSLSGSLTGAYALETLLERTGGGGDPDTELCINAREVERVDVVAATATRMRLARHRREHPRGRASIWLPRRGQVAARYADLLTPLPADVHMPLPGTQPPAHFALVPATQISDGEAARLAGEFLLDACARARISRRRARYATVAAMELADNALVHAAAAPDPPVLAVASLGRERVVEIAVTDAGTAVSEATDPLALVRTIPGRALAGAPGFLGQILIQGREAGVEVLVQVVAGTAHLVWTHNRHRTVRVRYVPGMTVLVRIGT